MYLAPVKDTDLIVAATTYIDEFSRPAKAIEGKMKQIERSYLDRIRGQNQNILCWLFCVLSLFCW